MTGTTYIIAMAIAVVLGVIVEFGRRRRIAEARFDSKTGKQIDE